MPDNIPFKKVRIFDFVAVIIIIVIKRVKFADRNEILTL